MGAGGGRGEWGEWGGAGGRGTVQVGAARRRWEQGGAGAFWVGGMDGAAQVSVAKPSPLGGLESGDVHSADPWNLHDGRAGRSHRVIPVELRECSVNAGCHGRRNYPNPCYPNYPGHTCGSRWSIVERLTSRLARRQHAFHGPRGSPSNASHRPLLATKAPE